MPLDLDSHLGLHQQALKLYSQRTEILANNLANADTPGFRARDIDFKAALAAAGGDGTSLRTTQSKHVGTGGASGAGPADLKYRVPLAPALDGNTVDVQVEQANFAQNAIRYQATLSFLSSKFRGLMTAITGQ